MKKQFHVVRERMQAMSVWLLKRPGGGLPAAIDPQITTLSLHRTDTLPAPPPPPAIDIAAAENASREIRIGIAVLLLFFVGLGGWAALAPLKGATVAPAVVKVEGSRKTVQHADGGTVGAIHVKEGARVTAGEVVLSLEDTTARTNANLLLLQQDSLRAQEARLVAEMTRAPALVFPPDLQARAGDPQLASILTNQADLFRAQQTIQAGQQEVMEKRIRELQEQIRGVKAQNASRASQLASVNSELSGLTGLYDKGLITRTRVLELERAASRLKGEENELAATMARDQQSIEQIRQEMLQVQYERYGQVANDLRDTQNRLADVKQRLLVAREALEQTRIKAPASGTVLGMTVFTVGAVVQRGERLMEIVPDSEQLVIEASIRVDDIVYVHPGMEVEVRVTGFKSSITPIVWGRVLHVSPDRLTETRTGTPYYLAQITVPPEELARLPQKLVPGMSVTTVIPTGERTALGYLLQPLRDAAAMAFREH
jgi:HlyD family type I secretion membrane fusion protein